MEDIEAAVELIGAVDRATSTDPRSRLKVRYMGDKPPEPTRWVIGGLLPEGACLILGAEEKTGKSWLAFDIAIALASGLKVLGRWQPRRTGKTLIYSPEGGWAAIRQRLWGLCWARNLDPAVVLRNIPFIDFRLNLLDPDCVQRVRDHINLIQPDLLILDPLITVHTADENPSHEMQSVLNVIRDLGTANPGMCILVAHHLNKDNPGRSAFHGLRGSSAIGAWADGLIKLRKVSDEPGALRRIDVIHRDAPSPNPAGFKLEVLPGELPDLSAFRLDGCAAPQIGKSGQKGGRGLNPEIQQEVLQVCRNSNATLTRSQGADLLDMERGKFNRYFKQLEEDGKARLNAKGKMEVG